MKVFVCLFALVAATQASHHGANTGGYASRYSGDYVSPDRGFGSIVRHDNSDGYNAGYIGDFRGSHDGIKNIKIIKVVPQSDQASQLGDTGSFSGYPTSHDGHFGNSAGNTGNQAGYSSYRGRFSGSHDESDVKFQKVVHKNSGLLANENHSFSSTGHNRNNGFVLNDYNAVTNAGNAGYAYDHGDNQQNIFSGIHAGYAGNQGSFSDYRGGYTGSHGGFSGNHGRYTNSQSSFSNAPVTTDIKIIKVVKSAGDSYRGGNNNGSW